MTFRVRIKPPEASEAVEETEKVSEAGVSIEAEIEAAVVEGLLAGWTFYAPKHDLTRDLLLLNDRLGDAYFYEEYDKLPAADAPEGFEGRGARAPARGRDESTRHGDDEEEPVQDENWFRWLYRQASETIFHGDEGAARRRGQSEEESVDFFRTFVSERVYNHLAMLARSRHARRGGSFSIRNELTRELAEKIGLGLYLHEKTERHLRTESEELLLRLAGDFQQWLVGEQRGVFVASWGGIHVAGKQIVGLPEGYATLALTPDVWADMARSARH